MHKVYLFDQYTLLSENLISRALQFLPADRCTRALRYRRDIDRNNCVVTYLMLLYGLRECFGIKSFEIALGKYGKPFLSECPEVHFSIGHCNTGCVVAVADRPVGVDIQDVRPVLREVAQRVCSARELEEFDQSQNQDLFFTRIWVAKESYGKMTGTGVLCELQDDHWRNANASIHVDEGKNYTIGLCIKNSAD